MALHRQPFPISSSVFEPLLLFYYPQNTWCSGVKIKPEFYHWLPLTIFLVLMRQHTECRQQSGLTSLLTLALYILLSSPTPPLSHPLCLSPLSTSFSPLPLLHYLSLCVSSSLSLSLCLFSIISPSLCLSPLSFLSLCPYRWCGTRCWFPSCSLVRLKTRWLQQPCNDWEHTASRWQPSLTPMTPPWGTSSTQWGFGGWIHTDAFEKSLHKVLH